MVNATIKNLTEDEYEKILTDTYGTFAVGSRIFDAGEILRKIDPIAFNVGMDEEPDVWECTECGSKFNSDEEAEKCCTDEV